MRRSGATEFIFDQGPRHPGPWLLHDLYVQGAPALEKVKGKQQPLDPREKARQEQLERESGVRAKLEVIRENVTNILQVIERIARHAPKLALDNLESLSAVSTPLLSSKLLHGEALETTQALAKCLPSPLDRKAGDLANCLWLRQWLLS